MKRMILTITIGTLVIACNNSGKTEDKTNESVSTESTPAAINQNVNTDLKLNLKAASMDKAGLDIGIPENWTVETLLEWGESVSYQVKHDSDVMLIETFQDAPSEDNLQTILDGYGKKTKIITKEDLDEKENTKVIGVTYQFNEPKPKREILFQYLLKFSKGKSKYAKITAGDVSYNAACIDTCIAIIKSIKPKK